MRGPLATAALALVCLASARPAAAVDPDPAQCSFPAVVLGSVAYDSTLADDPFRYDVLVRDAAGNPIGNVLVTLDFSACVGEAIGGRGPFPAKPFLEQPYHGGVSCSTRRIFGVTRADGHAVLRPLFGGWESTPLVRISAGRIVLGYAKARSTDLDDNGRTDTADLALFRQAFTCSYARPVPSEFADFNLSGGQCAADTGDLLTLRRQFLCGTTLPAPCERPLCP